MKIPLLFTIALKEIQYYKYANNSSLHKMEYFELINYIFSFECTITKQNKKANSLLDV